MFPLFPLKREIDAGVKQAECAWLALCRRKKTARLVCLGRLLWVRLALVAGGSGGTLWQVDDIGSLAAVQVVSPPLHKGHAVS